MSIVDAGGLFPCAAALLTILAVLTIVRRQPRRPIEAKATRCPSTPFITAFRYDDTSAGGIAGVAVLARRLRQRRLMQRLLQ